MWSLPLLAAVSLMMADAADIIGNMQVTNNNDDSFEGMVCFHLPDAILAWEIILDFTTGVREVNQPEGIWLQAHNDSECATHWTMVNKHYPDKHEANEYLCVILHGIVCNNAMIGGTAILKDLTHDGQQVPAPPQVAGSDPMKYNYAEVLQKSIMFYEAQRSGKLPPNNRIPWRGDSGLQDQGKKGEDLTGGWYDAGDNMKFGFPMAFSTTILCWGLLEFQEAYEQSGQLDYMYDCIRWPLEYFLKCHTEPNELYVQVGDGGVDHDQWTSSERMDQSRQGYKIDAYYPGSDVAMETAAAMACGSIAFKSKDSTFSSTLLSHAKQLYDFGKNHQGFYSESLSQAQGYYQSSNYTDENSWGALWLYWATNQGQYLQDAKVGYSHDPAWGFSWDEKNAGNQLLMYKFTKDQTYLADVEGTYHLWSKAGGFTYTPKCLAFRLQWGSLRYSANMAFIFLVASKYGVHSQEYRQWAMCQIHYALGDSGRSFVVGFGVNPPQKPHHRSSSCPMLPLACSWEVQNSPEPNPHTLYGALVGGPGDNDDYIDSRTDYVHNEVSCDYNAGFQSSVAALLQLAIDHQLPDPNQCGRC